MNTYGDTEVDVANPTGAMLKCLLFLRRVIIADGARDLAFCASILDNSIPWNYSWARSTN
jgi:hypothetical protein